MARTKSVSDASLMSSLQEVLRRVGPTQFTLADVAKEVGLTPATLVQRFGSKRGLLLTFARREAENAAAPFRRALAATKSPLQALRNGLITSTNRVDSRQQVVNGLAMLIVDLDDPELLAATQLHSGNVLAAIRELLEAAVAAGELDSPNLDKLARCVHCAWNGAIIQWAIVGELGFEIFLDQALSPLLGTPPRTKLARGIGKRKALKK